LPLIFLVLAAVQLAAIGGNWVLVLAVCGITAALATSVGEPKLEPSTTVFLILAPWIYRLSVEGASSYGDVLKWMPWVLMFFGALSPWTPNRSRALWMAFLLVLMVIYFSGTAGGPDPMREWLARYVSPENIETALIIIRKTIHFTFYATLAGFAWGHFRTRGLSLGFPLAVASFDEGRQFGVASRSGQAIDVALDMSGAALAVWLLWRTSRRRTEEDVRTS
jgi:VanZ family protein